MGTEIVAEVKCEILDSRKAGGAKSRNPEYGRVAAVEESPA